MKPTLDDRGRPEAEASNQYADVPDTSAPQMAAVHVPEPAAAASAASAPAAAPATSAGPVPKDLTAVQTEGGLSDSPGLPDRREFPDFPESGVLHRLIRDARFRERSRSPVRFPPADPVPPGPLPVGFAGTQASSLPRIPTAISSRAAHPARARHGTVLDAHEASLSSPWGTLTVLASAAGVVRLSFADDGGGSTLAHLSKGLRIAPERSRAHVKLALEQLQEYIAHRRRRFDLPVDLGPFGLYHREVLGFLPRLRYGHTVSYGELATATGRPLAMRAVGAACALNPVPIIFPCHRVIHADGSLGGHIAGTWVKHALLTHEGVFDE